MKIATTAALLFLSFVSSSFAKPSSLRKLATTKIDFASPMHNPGDIVTSLDGGTIVVTAMVRPSSGASLVPGEAMIFDSSNPTGGDTDLGTPHKTVPGGVGEGKGGKPGSSLFPNLVPQGNLLIVQTPGAIVPNDNRFGGKLIFDFVPPRDISSIGLLDNEEGVAFEIYTSDGGYSEYFNGHGGDNSFEDVMFGKPSVVKLVVRFEGSGAVSYLQFSPPTLVCYLPLDDLDSYSAGDEYTGSTGVTVAATKSNGGPAIAMIFDSSNPTGGDEDLGTPNHKKGGPGRGKFGKPSSLFPNLVALGNLIIVSEDGDSADPDDDEKGGVLIFDFKPPRDLHSIYLLDNEEGCRFDFKLEDGTSSSIFNMNGGNNSVEHIPIGLPQVTQMKVEFLGSGAITGLAVPCI